jgi:hypothetical protein
MSGMNLDDIDANAPIPMIQSPARSFAEARRDLERPGGRASPFGRLRPPVARLRPSLVHSEKTLVRIDCSAEHHPYELYPARSRTHSQSKGGGAHMRTVQIVALLALGACGGSVSQGTGTENFDAGVARSDAIVNNGFDSGRGSGLGTGSDSGTGSGLGTGSDSGTGSGLGTGSDSGTTTSGTGSGPSRSDAGSSASDATVCDVPTHGWIFCDGVWQGYATAHGNSALHACSPDVANGSRCTESCIVCNAGKTAFWSCTSGLASSAQTQQPCSQ